VNLAWGLVRGSCVLVMRNGRREEERCGGCGDLLEAEGVRLN
jgi:hypothetical protein